MLDNLDKIALKIGYENLPLAYDLARVQWRDSQHRDSTVDALIYVPAVR